MNSLEKLRKELVNLEIRLNSVIQFIVRNDEFRQLSATHKRLLQDQEKAMTAYKDVLALRIRLLESEEESISVAL